jgi:hypothetical protein
VVRGGGPATKPRHGRLCCNWLHVLPIDVEGESCARHGPCSMSPQVPVDTGRREALFSGRGCKGSLETPNRDNNSKRHHSAYLRQYPDHPITKKENP